MIATAGGGDGFSDLAPLPAAAFQAWAGEHSVDADPAALALARAAFAEAWALRGERDLLGLSLHADAFGDYVGVYGTIIEFANLGRSPLAEAALERKRARRRAS